MPTQQSSNVPGSAVVPLLAALDELRAVLAGLAGGRDVGGDESAVAAEDDNGLSAAEHVAAEPRVPNIEDEQSSAGARAAADPALGPDPAFDRLEADEHLALLRELVQHAAEIRGSLRRIEGRGQPALFTEPPLAD